MIFQFGDFTLDIAQGCLRTADREVDLRPKSFEVLRCLVENAGRLVTKDELIKAVWPNVIVTDESLARCISEVRQAIADSDQKIIKTVPAGDTAFRALSRSIRRMPALRRPRSRRPPPAPIQTSSRG
jgi:DNA-binding winged helix-turn-helix (wHTH) protein